MPRPSSRTSNLLLAAVSLALCLLLVEGGLRVAGISYPSFYQADPDRGGALRPGAEGWWRAEGQAYIRINSDGLRDREHTVAKPPGTFRIAVLGDSFTEAMQVPVEKTFWAVLERELSRCSGRRVEVINFGVSGYGTAQELLTLPHAWKYQPDAVLLAFFTGNDIRNNSRALNRDPGVPYFEFRDGRLILDDSHRKLWKRPGRWQQLAADVRNRSRIVQLASFARLRLAQGFAARAAASEPQAAELGVDAEVYAPPKDAAWQEAWRVTEALLARMNLAVRSHGARFWLVTLSTGAQVHPNPEVRRAATFYPDLRLRAFAEREGIPAVTLAPAFAEYAGKHRVFLHGYSNTALGYGHWNEQGHRLAGELIARRLCAEH